MCKGGRRKKKKNKKKPSKNLHISPSTHTFAAQKLNTQKKTPSIMEQRIEKAVTYISAIALFSAMFLNGSKETWALTAAQIYFVSALIVNLFSQHLKVLYYRRLSQELYNQKKDSMTVMNLMTVVLLMIGIAFLIFFKQANI